MKRRYLGGFLLAGILILFNSLFVLTLNCQVSAFKALVVASPDPDHGKMINRTEFFLEKIALENKFTVDFTRDPNQVNEANLANYQIFIQLHLAPFELSYQQQEALQKFIEQGKGWVGIHAAGLTGKQFIDSATTYWQWFQEFFGDVVYSPHPEFQRGTVIVEDHHHPVTKNLPASFEIWDEWYEFDRSPRSNVRVLATADESTFKQVKPMGDHPIIWVNEKYDRMVYIGIGHDTSICSNPNFEILMRDAILWAAKPRFKAVVLAESGGQHGPFTDAAKVWLQKLASDSNFTVDYIVDADKIDETFLAEYKVLIQLDFPPYTWPEEAMAAFEKYISEGKGGGWVGFHHATLLGEFDGYPMWPWFSNFMGDIRFENYIAGLAAGKVKVEDQNHPVMKNIPSSFLVEKEEWYTWDKNPRPNVHVLASVDESTYSPISEIKMGDHPVVWTNEHFKARNIYIFMGHHPDLFKNEAYTTLVRNAIFWAANH